MFRVHVQVELDDRGGIQNLRLRASSTVYCRCLSVGCHFPYCIACCIVPLPLFFVCYRDFYALCDLLDLTGM